MGLSVKNAVWQMVQKDPAGTGGKQRTETFKEQSSGLPDWIAAGLP